MLQIDPPDRIRAAFDEIGNERLLCTQSDLNREGGRASPWLVVYKSQVTVWEESAAFPADGQQPGVQPVLTVRIEEAKSFRTRAAVGAGVLQVQTETGWVDLVRYTNALADRFVKISAKLEDLRKDGVLEISASDELDERKCSRCGLTLAFVGDVCPRCVPRQAILRRVLGLIAPYRTAAIWLCILVLGGLAVELAPPLLQKHLVDDVLKLNETPDERTAVLGALFILVALLAASRLAASILAWLKGVLAVRVGAGLTHDLRNRLVAKLQALSMGYYDKHQVGVLVNRVAQDTEAMHSVIAHLTGGFVMQILQLIGVGAMLFVLNPKLAAFMLLPAPLVVVGSWFFWRYIYPLYYRYWDSSSKQAGALSGMLSGIRVVKAFGQEQREIDRFERQSSRLHLTRVDVESSTATFSAVMQIVFSLGGLTVWYVGGRDVLFGSMSLGALIAFLSYLAMFYAPLSNITQLTAWLGGFMTASQRVFELLDTPEQLQEAGEPKRLADMKGRIDFENVVFGYDHRRPVLKDVSFSIEPGEMIGIVGRSGSGKTTVVNLAARFYDADAGRVLIDGVDVRELSREDLRRQVGAVLQEPFLFRGTIWNNLTYGKTESTPEEVLTASRAAHAHDFIMRMPLGYESPVGERGAGLSGGERQRLSIARTVLYDPKILILDEATSSVDTESEKAIQDALADFTRGRTTIAIAHRLSTLRHADRIFVFDAGKLVEQGDHRNLIRLGGIYANLVRIQTRLGGEDNLDRLIAAEKAVAVVEPEEREPEDTEPPVASKPLSRSDAAPSLAEPTEPTNLERPKAKPIDDFWLDPCNCECRADAVGGLTAATIDGEVYNNVHAVQAFPASWPTRYISLRFTDSEGKEREIGILRDLDEWPENARALVLAAIARHHTIREIKRIYRISVDHNILTIEAETDLGRTTLEVRWTQASAIDFGEHGKLLYDVDDNLWAVRDVDQLAPRDQTLFRRYFYW